MTDLISELVRRTGAEIDSDSDYEIGYWARIANMESLFANRSLEFLQGVEQAAYELTGER